MLCAMVKAVTIVTVSQKPRASARRASRNIRWSMPPRMCSTPITMKLVQPVSAIASRSTVALRLSSRKANSTDGRPDGRTLSTVWKCAHSTSGQSSRIASTPDDLGHDKAISSTTLPSPALEPRMVMRPGWQGSPAIAKRA